MLKFLSPAQSCLLNSTCGLDSSTRPWMSHKHYKLSVYRENMLGCEFSFLPPNLQTCLCPHNSSASHLLNYTSYPPPTKSQPFHRLYNFGSCFLPPQEFHDYLSILSLLFSLNQIIHWHLNMVEWVSFHFLTSIESYIPLSLCPTSKTNLFTKLSKFVSILSPTISVQAPPPAETALLEVFSNHHHWLLAMNTPPTPANSMMTQRLVFFLDLCFF